MGWTWVLWWPAIGAGFGAVVVFFILEETNYDRKPVLTTAVYDASETPCGDEAAMVVGDPGAKSAAAAAAGPDSDSGLGSIIGYQKKPYWKRLSLMDKKRPNKLWVMFIRPFKLFSLPILLYCGFANGLLVTWSTVALGVSSVILSSPPYFFSATSNGLINIASLIGIISA